MKFIVVLLACVLAVANGAKDPGFGIYGGGSLDKNQEELISGTTTRVPIKPVIPTAQPVVVPAFPIVVQPSSVPAFYPEVYPSRPSVHPSIHPAVPITTSDDGSAKTIRFESEINNDGHNFLFETTNGIAAQAELNYGKPPKTSISGKGYFSWTSPEGKFIEVHYTADDDGYQPTGDAIPVVSAQMARALEYAEKFSARIKH